MADSQDDLSDVLSGYTRDEIQALSGDSKILLRFTSGLFEKLRQELHAERQATRDYRIHMERRMDILEGQITPDVISKRSEIETQHRIMWAAFKLGSGVLLTSIIGALLYVIGLKH